MHFGVAIEATPAQQESIGKRVFTLLRRIAHAGMPCRCVTLLAKKRWSLGEHCIMVAAVWAMAQCAVFGDRRVLPQKRSTLLRVAGETGLVHGRLLQKKIIITGVGVMAVTAGHASEPEWVVATSLYVGLAILVAAEAGLLLGKRVKYAICFTVKLVTGGTRHFFCLVRAAEPTQSAMGLVAAQTDFVLLFCGRFCPHPESYRRQQGATAALGTCMVLAGPVAGFAL